MKHIFFLLLLGIASLSVMAQPGTTLTDSLSLVAGDSVPDTNEAGAINAADADPDNDKAAPGKNNWWYGLLGGALIGAIGAVVVLKASGKKNNTVVPEPAVETPVAVETEKGTKITAAEVKKLRQELKQLNSQLEAAQANNNTLEKNLDIYRNFDNNYYNEAFRKLIVPMNEALETGSRTAITEHLLRIMAHFSSLTRYKIAKKQPYDEANIHYLLNQKGNNDGGVAEINSTTPVDKIPKNIKTITDILQEQQSKGLDESIIAGYKIKNL